MSGLELTCRDGRITLALDGRVLIRHTPDRPFVSVGIGRERIAMHRGNFDISDTVQRRWPLRCAALTDASLSFSAAPDEPPALVLHLSGDAGHATLRVAFAAPELNRFWFRIAAEPDEHVWGCGEQMSYFDLRGRRFPLWTSEPGVGRDKSTELTRRADTEDRAGGDYWTTNYPQPTFLSSRRIAVHLGTTAYSVFDFTDPDAHELEVWSAPESIELFSATGFPTFVSRLSARFGRPPRLPGWAMDGAIIGLKDGAASFTRLQTYLDAGCIVSALWCEDWCGVRATGFGQRLFWDWRWSPERYPDLDRRIAELHARGIRFLGYVNPYLCDDGTLFREAEQLGHLARNTDGGTLLVDFGEFDCGVLDFTSPAACDWFADRVIGREMLGFGLDGWMADFGEYLPTDAVLANGADARLMHNAWPVLWASVNATAVARAGRTGDALFFMRAGFTGIQPHCPLLWAGDQSVDFSRHDGLQTAICGALSSGLLGNPYHHSDIGGYTSLFGNVRTVELLQRWAEMAAFTPVMRTHEGNRPADNPQIDSSAETLCHFARMTKIHRCLGPYLRAVADEAASTGLPMQRPLFLHHPEDAQTYAVQDQYLLGPDLLIAPVHAAGAVEWPVYLPEGAEWVNLWTGARTAGGARIVVAAPIGSPPVFWRAETRFYDLFHDWETNLAAL